ncbi:MAG: ABC transporter permease [Candidatus Hadarchaeia archaeon]
MAGSGKRIWGKLTSPFAMFIYKKIVFFAGAAIISMTFLFFLQEAVGDPPHEVMVRMAQARGGGNVFANVGGGSSGGSVGRWERLAEIYAEQFGVLESIESRFVDWWKNIFTLNFGPSVTGWPREVTDMIARRLPWTIALVLPALPFGFVIGNWIGSRAAYYGGKLDNFLYYLSNYLQRAPVFWVALIVVMIFAGYLDILPSGGAYDTNMFITGPRFELDFFISAVKHWIIPFFTIALLPIGGWAVGMRSMTLYEMESDYMQYSKQLGFSEEKLRQIAERNAILPNFTGIPQIFNILIGQTLIVEIVMGYNGLGYLFYDAAVPPIDVPLLQATFLITLLIVLAGNFVIDVLYGVLDPRIGTGYVGGE